MSIAVRCRLCGRPYNLSSRLAGQVVQCKECQAPIEVPAASKPPGATAAPRPQVAAPASLPRQPVSAQVVSAPIPLAPLPFSPLPAAPLATAPLPAAPPRARRAKQSTSPVMLILGIVAVGALGLGTLATVAFVAFKLMPASKMFAGASHAPPTTPFSGSNARQFEELVQKALAALQGFNGILSQVVDGASARRLSDQVLARYHEFMALRGQLLAFTPRLTAEEDRRLGATYNGPLKAAVDQLQTHATRIRQIQDAELAFGDRLSFDNLHQGMGMPPSFQPPAPPTFTPPADFGRRTPNRPPIVPPTIGPRHPPFNQGQQGPGAMHPPFNHGPRGPGAMPGRRGR